MAPVYSLILALALLSTQGRGATPAAEVLGPSAEPFDCLTSGPGVLSKCGKEVALARKEIDFGQTTVATQAVIDGIVDQLQDEELPSAACCDIAVTFNENACQCDPTLTGLLPEVGVQVPALISILKVMEAACGTFEIQEC